MSAHKHINKIISAFAAAAVILCFLATVYADELTERLGGTGVKMEYESRLFDTDEVMQVNILIDEDDWNEMLANAIAEEYYVCDVVINGTKIRNTAIRPKGNTSLSAIAMDPETDRYSFKLEFDHFVEGQTCFGLDKLILNNNYADATNMKEAVIYDMYQYLGADASLYNYAEVYVNGAYWGVYLALEGVEESFMLRNFGTQDGELYKPDSMEMGGNSSAGSPAAGAGGMTPPSNAGGFPSGNSDKRENSSKPSGGFSSGGGANLNYTDDDPDSYSVIWEGEITGTGNADHKRVIEALKNISEGNDLETYLDVDNILKYMAVHAFAVNMDSLSGSMAHNYYLYEYQGQLNIFPWDYNLSFGGMSMSSNDASDVVNDAIDTPFSGTKFFDALLSDEEYLERYHAYLQELVDEYINGGRFDETYNRIRNRIDTLVQNDPTAFYSYEEYQNAADILYETVKLRAESISGQLDGTIPSTDAGQRQDSSALIDASHIDIKAMGQFNMGGTSSGDFGGRSDWRKKQNAENGTEQGAEELPEGNDPSGQQGGFQPGNMPGGFDSDNMPEGFDFSNMPENFQPGNMPQGGFSQPSDDTSGKTDMPKDDGRETGGSALTGRPDQNAGWTGFSNLAVYGACLVLMAAAFLTVKLCSRRR